MSYLDNAKNDYRRNFYASFCYCLNRALYSMIHPNSFLYQKKTRDSGFSNTHVSVFTLLVFIELTIGPLKCSMKH